MGSERLRKILNFLYTVLIGMLSAEKLERRIKTHVQSTEVTHDR